MNLYKPEKYNVIVGKDSPVALCTSWFDPSAVSKSNPIISESIRLTGTLYSKEGVSIILRNLALNPTINKLILWTNTPLSNTPFGRAGWKLLKRVWKDPTDKEDIHKEIDIKIIERIVKNVELIDLPDLSFKDVLSFIQDKNFELKKAYMDAVSFPEHTRDDSAPFPSEKVGWVVRAGTIYNSWLLALDRIMRYGYVKRTEYGNNQREIQNINWIITSEAIEKPYIPDLDKKILELIGLNKPSLDKYKGSLLDPVIPDGTAYTYGSRLRAHGIDLFDQVDYMIKKLNEDIVTRRSVATTLIPSYDSTRKFPPCLVFVQALLDDNEQLNFFATFRSHDIFKAAIPNAYGLLNLQNYICKKTNLKRGILSINSVSAHVYEEDWDNAIQLLKCQKWVDVDTKFNENTDLDARGMVRLYLSEGNINLELVNFGGEVIYSIKGKKGKELITRIAKLNLLSNSAHYVYLTAEAIKAEIALNAGLEYKQDKKLVLNRSGGIMTLN